MKHNSYRLARLSSLAFGISIAMGLPHVTAAESLGLQIESAVNNSEIADLREQIQLAKDVIAIQRMTINGLKIDIDAKRTQRAELRDAIEEQREIIANSPGADNREVREEARQRIDELQVEIQAIKQTIDELKISISDARDVIQQQRDTIAQLRAQIKELRNDTGWAMVWNDEFDGSEIDTSKWNHEVDCWGGGNNEKQCYTDSPENSYVDNGTLKIVAKPETGLDLPYSSARLTTKYKGDWTYGRFEVRAKVPGGQGSWPAIWMLPTDEVYGGWPHSGEIDIFESVNLGAPLAEGSSDTEKHVHGTLHYGRSWPNNASSGQEYQLPDGENPTDNFHVYAIEWEEGEIRWYMDDVLYATQLQTEANIDTDGQAHGLVHRGWFTESNGETLWSSAPFDQNFYMILNFAVGGSWPENVNVGGIDADAFVNGNVFEIDYVRVYECSTGDNCDTTVDGYLEPIEDGGTLLNGAAPTPIKPSDGIARPLTIFDYEINEFWPAWDCCSTVAPQVVSDEQNGEVVEFTIGATPAVAGFNIYEADIAIPYDASPMADTGALEFDLKLVNTPVNGDVTWFAKVEHGGAATAVELAIEAPTSEWQHYTIPLYELQGKGLNLNGIDVVMIYPQWGQGEGATYRVDNVAFNNDVVTRPEPDHGLIVDFEEAADSYSFIHFDGGVGTVVANPQTDENNPSSQVGQMQKFAGQSWGGTVLNLPQATDLPEDTLITMNVWSAREVSVLFKLEGMNVERNVVHTGNGWEELLFDFSGDTGSGVNQITLIFDLGVMGDAENDPGNWTFYFDDIGLPGGDDNQEPPSSDPITIYDEGVTSPWRLWDCCGNAAITEVTDEDASYGLVANIDFFGGGGTVSGLTTDVPADISGYNAGVLEFDLKMVSEPNNTDAVWLMKVEANDGSFAEVPLSSSNEGAVPGLGQWQHYSFNLDTLSSSGLNLSNLKHILIFPQWGLAQGAIYRLDNVRIGEPAL